MKKNILNLGKALNTYEQKKIIGGNNDKDSSSDQCLQECATDQHCSGDERCKQSGCSMWGESGTVCK